MQTKTNLQARLSQVIDESLALLTKVYHQEPLQKTVTIPSPSLFDQCLELCAQQNQQQQEPLRTLHHFGLPLNSPLLTSLATLANTKVLTNIHPNNNSFKNSIKSQTIVTRHTNIYNDAAINTEEDEYRFNIFLNDLQQTQQQSKHIGLRLLICDNHCLSQVKEKHTTDLLSLLKRQFTVRSLIVVTDPVESYPVYCADAQTDTPPLDFEEYCQGILDFIQANPDLTVIRHEDFVAEPERVMREICDILELPVCEEFLVLGEVFTLKENSEQNIASGFPINPLSASEIYSQLCTALGYKNRFKIEDIQNKSQNLTKQVQALSEKTASNSEIEMLRSEIGILSSELTLALQNNKKQIKSYSQLGQDLWVLKKLNNKKKGFFVEFGATNGILLSNSYLLEKDFDWQGICAEPNPKFFAELTKNRNCICRDACIAGIDNKECEFILAAEYGSLAAYEGCDQHKQKRQAYHESGDTIMVTTQTLDTFLQACQAPKEIDYLSIDTEGSELEILEVFDLNKWQVKLLTIEHNFQEEPRQKIRKLLASYGYQVQEERWDDWFWREDLITKESRFL